MLDSRRLARQSDEEIVARLTTVKGIGKWSAEIFLMFQLRRLDVWPTGDLGVRKGYGAGLGDPDADAQAADLWASLTTRTGPWWPGSAGGRRSGPPGPGLSRRDRLTGQARR